MATSILDVWITNMGDPCSIANDRGAGIPHSWVVAVSHCSGEVVNWSEGRYRFHSDDAWTPIPFHEPAGDREAGWWYESIPTRDGHVEIELPPGCYVVRATMHSWFLHGRLFGNWATERAIVQACCGDEVCATLYAPSAAACWIPLFEFVLPLLAQHDVIPAAAVERAQAAMKGVIGGEAASAYEQHDFETLRRAFETMTPTRGRGTRRQGGGGTSRRSSTRRKK
jgi:hypothetical protein